MRQFAALFGYELKKIAVRKSTWIILGVILFYFGMEHSIFFLEQSGYVESGVDSSAGEEEWRESLSEQMKRDIENAHALSGRKLDNALLQEKREYENSLQPEKMSARERAYAVERYRPLLAVIAAYTGLEEEEVAADFGQLDMNQIEWLREEYVAGRQSGYLLRDEEKQYWQREEQKLEKPLVLRHSGTYETLINFDMYLCLLLATFWIAVVVSPVFADEHSRGVDQLTLSSKLGRKPLYFAKLAAGIVFSAAAGMLILLVRTLMDIQLWELGDFDMAVQEIAGWYSGNLCIGQVFLLMLAVYIMAVVLTVLLAIVFVEKFRSGVLAVAGIVVIAFAARLIQFPVKFRLLSQIWNYFPLNMLNLGEGFLDLRLVPVFGLQLTSWQFALFLYALLTPMLILLGKRLYCRCQV